MAYRKTDGVLAALAAKREAILEAALSLMAEIGAEGVTTNALAARAKVGVGSLFTHFPNIEEIKTAAAGQVLAGDLAAMREAASRERFPLNALAAALAVFYRRQTKPRLARALAGMPAYRNGVRRELARLIAHAMDIDGVNAKLLAAASLGALYGVLEALGAKHDEGPNAAISYVLLGLGVPSRGANGIAERISASSAP